jgi:hypothetical protein
MTEQFLNYILVMTQCQCFESIKATIAQSFGPRNCSERFEKYLKKVISALSRFLGDKE